jgi:sec-independent protein translocase protein TatC
VARQLGGEMPLLQHLAEFRDRVFRSAIVITIGFVVAWFFYNEIIAHLAKPVCDLKLAQAKGSSNCGALYINGVLGPINLQIKVSLIASLIVTAPLWIYQLWAFVAPGLHKHEKRRAFYFLLAATPFFALGVYMGYRVLPVAIRVLFGFTPNQLTNLINFADYLDFVLRVILLFGLAFELPVFLVTLNLLGAVSGKTILRHWRMWVFGITFFIAAFTPSADPLTMFLLAIPLVIFYFAAGGLALLNDRRKSRAADVALSN